MEGKIFHKFIKAVCNSKNEKAIEVMVRIRIEKNFKID
jgi:hypothetical protein